MRNLFLIGAVALSMTACGKDKDSSACQPNATLTTAMTETNPTISLSGNRVQVDENKVLDYSMHQVLRLNTGETIQLPASADENSDSDDGNYTIIDFSKMIITSTKDNSPVAFTRSEQLSNELGRDVYSMVTEDVAKMIVPALKKETDKSGVAKLCSMDIKVATFSTNSSPQSVTVKMEAESKLQFNNDILQQFRKEIRGE